MPAMQSKCIATLLRRSNSECVPYFSHSHRISSRQGGLAPTLPTLIAATLAPKPRAFSRSLLDAGSEFGFVCDEVGSNVRINHHSVQAALYPLASGISNLSANLSKDLNAQFKQS